MVEDEPPVADEGFGTGALAEVEVLVAAVDPPVLEVGVAVDDPLEVELLGGDDAGVLAGDDAGVLAGDAVAGVVPPEVGAGEVGVDVQGVGVDGVTAAPAAGGEASVAGGDVAGEDPQSGVGVTVAPSDTTVDGVEPAAAGSAAAPVDESAKALGASAPTAPSSRVTTSAGEAWRISAADPRASVTDPQAGQDD